MQHPTLESLTDSLWTYAALMMLVEGNALPLLEKGTELEALTDATHISAQILQASLNVLAAAGFILQEKQIFKLAGNLQDLITRAGISGVTGQMQSNFGHVRELIAAAATQTVKPGWFYTDDAILQAQGKFSEIIATDFVPAFPEIAARLVKPGATFADIGAGVGRIALKMCELYPKLHAVALEPAAKPFYLAERNIAASVYQNRLELRKLGVQDLTDTAAFDAVWIAQGFIVDEHFLPGLIPLKRALKPGGILLTAEFPSCHASEKGLADYVMDFISNLYGPIRTPTELMALFEKVGFIEIESKLQGSFVIIKAVNPA